MSKVSKAFLTILKTLFFATIAGAVFYLLISDHLTTRVIFFNKGNESGYERGYNECKSLGAAWGIHEDSARRYRDSA